jgi:hypothetical protein
VIGTHQVMLYADPAAANWVQLATNAGMDASKDGWFQIAWGSPFTWKTGGYLESTTPTADYQGIMRDPDFPIVTPVNAARLRVRVKFTIPSPTRVFWGIRAGRTPEDAYGYPESAPGDSARVQTWTWEAIPAGTYSFETTWDPGFIGDLGYLSPSWHVGPTTAPVRLDYLDLAWRSGGGAVDLSCWVDDVAIAHGRSETTGQPEASAATLNLTAGPDDPLPPELDVGAVVTVVTTLPDVVDPDTGTVYESMRFTGKVTDVAMGWDDAGAQTPDAGVVQVVAVSPLADLGRRVVGAEPFPQELDGARVARITTLAGVTLDPAFSDPGTVQILARDIDAQSALDVAHGTAQSAGGLVWQTRSGDIRYADADHRRGIPATLDLDACDVLVTPTWARNLDGLVNAVAIGYGTAPEGGEQPTYAATDATSISRWGRYGFAFTSELAALADAQAMANLLLTRNTSPAWVMAALPVDLAGLSADATTQLLNLDMHGLARLTGLPSLGTAPTTAHLWVEGWTERLAFGVHDIELAVSDYCRTAPPPRWDDLSAAWTWDTVDPALTWNATTCLGPPVDAGRWTDVAASLRWDDAGTTAWDQWTATPTGV